MKCVVTDIYRYTVYKNSDGNIHYISVLALHPVKICSTMMKITLSLLFLVAVVAWSTILSVSAETIQPILLSDCDNSTAEAISAAMDAYVDTLLESTNPGCGSVQPGDEVEGSNMTMNRVRDRSLQEKYEYIDEDEEARRLFAICPKSCQRFPGIPVCRALKCRTASGTAGRRLQQNGQFTTNRLVEKLNMRASQLSLAYGCQVSLFIMPIT